MLLRRKELHDQQQQAKASSSAAALDAAASSASVDVDVEDNVDFQQQQLRRAAAEEAAAIVDAALTAGVMEGDAILRKIDLVHLDDDDGRGGDDAVGRTAAAEAKGAIDDDVAGGADESRQVSTSTCISYVHVYVLIYSAECAGLGCRRGCRIGLRILCRY